VNERLKKPLRNSTNPDNLVEIGPADSEITGWEFGPLKGKKRKKTKKTLAEHIVRSSGRPSWLNKQN